MPWLRPRGGSGRPPLSRGLRKGGQESLRPPRPGWQSRQGEGGGDGEREREGDTGAGHAPLRRPRAARPPPPSWQEPPGARGARKRPRRPNSLLFNWQAGEGRRAAAAAKFPPTWSPRSGLRLHNQSRPPAPPRPGSVTRPGGTGAPARDGPLSAPPAREATRLGFPSWAASSFSSGTHRLSPSLISWLPPPLPRRASLRLASRRDQPGASEGWLAVRLLPIEINRATPSSGGH